MGSRTLLFGVFCLTASLAVACGTEDDSAPPLSGGGATGNSGAAGRNGTAGSAGKSAGGGGSAGTGVGGGSDGGMLGEAGEGGTPGNDCTPFAPFVHGLIKDSTTAKAAPTPVNGLVFCEDPQDPAAFSDLF
jgi:hypothetical protein